MEAKICVCLHNMKPTQVSQPSASSQKQEHELEEYRIKALACSDPKSNTITFTCPPSLQRAHFPVAEATFRVEQLLMNPDAQVITKEVLSEAANKFVTIKENLVVFAYGVRSTPRRELMYGSSLNEGKSHHYHHHHHHNYDSHHKQNSSDDVNMGYACEVVSQVIANDTNINTSSNTNNIYTLSCYVMAYNEHVIDLIKADNDVGVIVDSVKEGPRVRMIERVRLSSIEQVREIFNSKIVPNYTHVFAEVLSEKMSDTREHPENSRRALDVLPQYNGQTIVLQLLRYEDESSFANYNEANSLSFIALADAERPVLCGVDQEQQITYERVHRTLLSAVNMVASIRCNRLRIPFGKSKLSQMLRRAYNSERNYKYNACNAPTRTCLLIHCFMESMWAEESYHELIMTKRISNPVGFTLIGSPLRDLIVEKWRLDQDITELKDELIIAKTVYDYKPSIYESAKPITNIREEENKRINSIVAKRDEIRERQLALIRQRAKEQAAKMIAEQEAASGTTLRKLEETLARMKAENATLQADRTQRTKEYEQSLEKLRRKKEEEENKVSALKEELGNLEQELALRQVQLQSKQQQLELAKLDKTKCRDALRHERESVEVARRTVNDDRRRQRQQWIRQIKEMNDKVREQMKTLTEERARYNEQRSANEEATEQAVINDVETIEEYLPKLITLEEEQVNLEEVETLRRQFDEVFAQDKAMYLSKIEVEKARKEKLEKGLEVYQMRILEAAQAKKKENVESTVEKEHHLTALIDQVLIYLRQGVRMTKISSKGHVRRRFYFLSEDGKRIHSCEMDNQGGPINRRKPPVTIWLKDIKKIVMGIYTSSFVNFSTESQLEKTRRECVTDNGTYRAEPTQTITPANLGINNYRAFALLLKGGKSLEVVCDSDSDCEAWLVALKRYLHIKTSVEKLVEQIVRNGETLLPNAVATAMEDSVDKTTNTAIEMGYGGKLDIRNMRGFVSLSLDEAELCGERHIPPALFLRVKQEVIDKAVNGVVSIYDVRVSSGLDLIRSGFVYDYLVENRLVALPV